ncbi:hypothetical protein QJS10_CPA08g01763 [Acorus calamus]|uniref:Prolyl endopeptidase n=1 Tax=Acorus calamus TaxID=4465 RepID=A0AAV9E9V3_ACOCL|nr:hypothetical protein QJS10_CPA08g01763 [Acorus calamus]
MASFSDIQYPIARRDESVVDDYHGVSIADPYRWLEDPEAKEVKEFVEKQTSLTESILGQCETREDLRRSIKNLYDHPRFTTPSKKGNKNGLEEEAEVLFDPNKLSEDGTIALDVKSMSEDAKYMAYALSSSGSDWLTIKVMRVDDKVEEPDCLHWVKFSNIGWTHDGKGFFYSRYPAPKEGTFSDAGAETNVNLNQEVRYHLLGTDQSEDILCWRDPDHPEWLFVTQISDDGKYLLLFIRVGASPFKKLYYCDLSAIEHGLEGFKERNEMLPFIKLVDDFEASYQYVANDESEFTFLTNKNAPKQKLVRVDIKKPEKWVDVLPESESDVLESANAVNGNQLLVCYLSDVKYVMQLRDLESGHLLHDLPIDIGTVHDISCRRKDNEFFIKFTGFLTSGVIYKFKLESGVPEMEIFREIIVPGFDKAEFEAKQVFFPSKDGTKVPMFVVSKKDIQLDGSHPLLLYGYGGFSISLTPYFDVVRIVLMRHLGVVFCMANIRGGGEYGEEWHKAGSLSRKQNCFDDFISAAEYLVSAGYTHPNKLCIKGGSNGGILVGACINQRPDLFGCALASVGVMDMLRFHKFTIGHAWISEFGCSDKEEEFNWLIKYSPLHNVKRPWEQTNNDQKKNLQYPATMLLTADHDDRVVPLHSLKLLAIDEAADQYSFMAKMLGVSWIN